MRHTRLLPWRAATRPPRDELSLSELIGSMISREGFSSKSSAFLRWHTPLDLGRRDLALITDT
jgi:hypothetical protein